MSPTNPNDFGRYRLLRRVSVGGMAEIFKARVLDEDEDMPELVAIKRLLPHIEEDPELVAHFLAEARLVARLDHPLIARTLEVGRVGDSPFIAMEYVVGVDLQELMRRLVEASRRGDTALVCAVGIQAAHALDHAHHALDEQGRPFEIVHRDVSPQNFMLGATGELKLIDFGIAKYAGREGQTKTGIVKGKHAYMSPEQVRRKALDGRSDLFSLGVILWELAVGERLFRAETVLETLERVDNAEVAPPHERAPGLDHELSALIMACLSKQPEGRPARASDLATRLEAVLARLEPEGRDEAEAFPGIAQAMAVLAGAYAEFIDEDPLEQGPTLDEYRATLDALELGEDRQLLSRDPSDITVVPDTADLLEYVARLRARSPTPGQADPDPEHKEEPP